MLWQYSIIVAGEWVTCICVMQWNIFDLRVSNNVFVILCFCKEVKQYITTEITKWKSCYTNQHWIIWNTHIVTL